MQQHTKIRELKKLLSRSKYIAKFKVKCIELNELIKKAMFNSNNTKAAKYGYSPEQIEEKALDPEIGKYFQEVYDFPCLIKVKENRDQTERYDAKVDKHKKRLGDFFEIGEKVLVGPEFLRKKYTPGRLYKSTTENESFFNRDRSFAISERSKLNNNTYLYCVKENGLEIKNRYLKQ